MATFLEKRCKKTKNMLHLKILMYKGETKMILTPREKYKKTLLKFGHQNFICRFLAIPFLFLGMLFFHIVDYIKSNTKRYAMFLFVFILFAVYSSFSFPMFSVVSENKLAEGISEEAKNVKLANEVIIDLDEMEILKDQEMNAEEESLSVSEAGMHISERYDYSDLKAYHEKQKESLQQYVNQEGNTDDTFSKEDWRLILVNKQHSIPEGYEESVPLGNIKTMKGIMCCDERIIDDLLEMIQTAKEDGVILEICSPYRDLEYQEKLFSKKITKYMSRGLSYMEAYQLASTAVTVPNASEHQIGLALDIVTNTYTTLNEGFGNTSAGKWLAENSANYGFILRYPKGKEDITGIEYEPWHFRYVGKEAAKVITEREITLEEFWEEL